MVIVLAQHGQYPMDFDPDKMAVFHQALDRFMSRYGQGGAHGSGEHGPGHDDDGPHDHDDDRKAAEAEGKPANVIDRIVDGKLKKFLDENCLLRQEYIRDDEKTVEELLKETIASTGENITLRRFERWELGEAVE